MKINISKERGSLQNPGRTETVIRHYDTVFTLEASAATVTAQILNPILKPIFGCFLNSHRYPQGIRQGTFTRSPAKKG